jgi:hypothetical protein
VHTLIGSTTGATPILYSNKFILTIIVVGVWEEKKKGMELVNLFVDERSKPELVRTCIYPPCTESARFQVASDPLHAAVHIFCSRTCADKMDQFYGVPSQPSSSSSPKDASTNKQ